MAFGNDNTGTGLSTLEWNGNTLNKYNNEGYKGCTFGLTSGLDKNGNLIDVSMYKNGVRDGKSVFFDEKGNVLISVWKKGELVSQKLITDEGE